TNMRWATFRRRWRNRSGSAGPPNRSRITSARLGCSGGVCRRPNGSIWPMPSSSNSANAMRRRSGNVSSACTQPSIPNYVDRWRSARRLDGSVVGTDAAFDGIQRVHELIGEQGMIPLLVAPVGGRYGDTDSEIPVERTYATMRSVEFDSIILADGVEPVTEIA